ncbi:hypothetical protein AAG906_002784 [Vitis piasezkii]
MVANPRATFKERQRKRLSKTITSSLLLQKALPGDSLPMAYPGYCTDTSAFGNNKLRRPSSCPVQLNDDSIECVASGPPHPQASRASREEITELMKATLTFPSRPNLPLALEHRCFLVTDVQNLMRQRALLFKWLEVAKAMRAYIAHNMNDNEELHSKPKAKVEEGKGAIKAEARRLVEKEVIEARHKKVEWRMSD